MGSEVYEVEQNGTGWMLRARDRTPLVEFATEKQAVRAAIAVCLDVGLARLRITRADGGIEELDLLALGADALEV